MHFGYPRLCVQGLKLMLASFVCVGLFLYLTKSYDTGVFFRPG